MNFHCLRLFGTFLVIRFKDVKKILLSKLTSEYGMADESTYPYFRSAAIKITSIQKALAGADDATDV